MASRSQEGAATLDALRADALVAVRRYAEEAFAEREFVPGETNVPGGGPRDRRPGARGARRRLARRLAHRGPLRPRVLGGVRQGRGPLASRFLVGSGSQANLLAVAATTSHLHERPLQPGDEVITPALGFSTTVGPLYQYGLVPVYVDVELDTFNPSLDAIAAAISDRTRADPDRALPGQPVRRGGRGRALPRARPRADRGLLRRARLDLRRAAGGQLRSGGHLLVLPRPPHDDGRGRRGGGRRSHLAARDRLAARVGPRLLVPAGRERRLRQALRRPLRRAARRLRPQVRVLARGLQLQGHRHAGLARPRAARAPRGLRRAPPAQLRAPPGGARPARGPARAPARPSRRPTPPGSATRSRSATAARTTAATSSASCSSARSTTA